MRHPFAFAASLATALLLTSFAPAAPSGMLDEHGGTVGPDGKYHMVNPPKEAASRPAPPSTTPGPGGGPGDNGGSPDATPPPPVTRGLTTAQIHDLHETINEYWGYRINEEWRDSFLIESISLDNKVTEEQYAKGATIEPWFGRYTEGRIVTSDDIKSLGDGQYRLSYKIVQETGGFGEEKNTEVLAEIADRWKLIDGRWYHMPDEFVEKILKSAEGGGGGE